MGAHGKLERAQYRVFRWPCPICGAGYDDPIYRPLVIDSDGRADCEASHCSIERIGAKVRDELDINRLVESIEAAI